MKKYTIYIFLMLLGWSGCQEEFDPPFYNQDQLSITSYIESEEKYSELLTALQRLNMTSMLRLDGKFTVFLPANEAFQTYYQEQGVTNLSQISDEDLTYLISSLIVEGDLYESYEFPCGRLAHTNIMGFNLMTVIGGEDGNTFYVNNIPLKEVDISLLNGVAHEISALIPLRQSIAEVIEERSDLSIFYEALTVTGVIDELTDVSEESVNRFTVLAESNALLLEKGVTTVEEYAALYTDQTDYTSGDNFFHQMIRYHVVEKYLPLNDVINNRAYATLIPSPVTFYLNDEAYVVNAGEDDIDDTGNVIGDVSTLQTIDYVHSNAVGINGVVHTMNTMLEINRMEPQEVIFDMYSCEKDLSLLIDPMLNYNFSWNHHISYHSTSVGDNFEFYGPYLFKGIKYKVYYQTTGSDDGYSDRTIFSLHVNEEQVGENFIGRFLNSVGVLEIKETGIAKIKIQVEGSYIKPDDNKIRCKYVRFVPVFD